MNVTELIERYPILDSCKEDILEAAELMTSTYKNGGKILLCGNGGSASDCEHIAGELLKGFLSLRKVTDERISASLKKELQGSLSAIPLPSLTAALTASLNDLDPAFAYAQLLYGLGKEGDLLIAISTSGNAKNVLNAAMLAKELGIHVLALSGKTGGTLSEIADVCICVPALETYHIQELHLPVYHFLCAYVESNLFP